MPSFDAATQMPEFARYLEGRLQVASKRGMLSACHRTVQYIVSDLIPKAMPQPVDRGIYKAGWMVRSDGEEGYSVANRVPHATIIEHGVRGENVKIGKASLDAIAAWVQRKGIGGATKATPAALSAPKVEKPQKSSNAFVKQLKGLLKAMSDFIKRMRLGGEIITKPDGSKAQKGLTDAQARSMAWAILKSMQKKGIFDGGLKIAERALLKMTEFAEQEVAREITREFR